MAWFDDYPQILLEEENALIKEGYQYKIDKAARTSGCLIMNVTYPLGSESYELICKYPAAYPFFAPRVSCTTIPPGRHLNPYTYEICLFEDEQSVWNAHSDNLANSIKKQIPLILDAHSSPENASDIEGNVGYQVTGQIVYESNSIIFVDDSEPPDDVSFGEMTLRISKDCSAVKNIYGLIESIRSGSGNEILTTSDSPLKSFFESKITCRWVKLDTPPASTNGDEILNEAIQIWPAIKTRNFQNKGLDIVGLAIPEESGYRQKAYNWVFVVRAKLTKAIAKKNNLKYQTRIIRSDRYTKTNIRQRIPRLTPIVDKNVVVIGVGALGANIVWQLARAGVKSLTIIDFDIVQVGNIPRWILGLSAVGKQKVDAIRIFLAQNYPELKCQAINFRIGTDQLLSIDNKNVDAHDFIKRITSEADLVIDSAAETNVSSYLSHLCDEVRTPYVWATATQGGWGGIVGRVIPAVTEGRWMDFSYQYANGDISPPAAEEGSNIQPVGCFHPTFTGTGIDLDHVSLMAVRLSIATLCRNEGSGYPDFNWDVAVLNLWSQETEETVAPTWETHRLVEYKGSRNEEFNNSVD